MADIGLICEGPTDYAVLSRLFEGIAGRSLDVASVQPQRPMRPGDFSGWHQVFASIRRGDVSGAQTFNRVVVVQIDADVCEEVGFGVSRRVDGRDRTEAELVEAVRGRLLEEIAACDPGADQARLAFAICVNEIECWLLLSLRTGRPKTTGCFDAVNAALQKANRRALRKAEGSREYEDASADLRKPKTIRAIHGRSPSLAAFIDALIPLLAAT